MLIIVTDEGQFWNHRNPILERYADCVLVVCLSGKKVTDKYRCFVTPYPGMQGRGMPDNGLSGEKYRALASVSDKLKSAIGLESDLLFLTDNAPQSLLPYLAMKERKYFEQSFHLWCMPPAKFEGARINRAYFGLFTQVTGMDSLLYLDQETIFHFAPTPLNLLSYLETRKKLCEELFPNVLYLIERRLELREHYYFDFGLQRYLKLKDPLQSIQSDPPIPPEDVAAHKPNSTNTFGYSLTWLLSQRKTANEIVETPHSRMNGKKVCEQLKEMRRALVRANGLTLDIPDCPSTGPCAGTCPQCDAELRQLQQLLEGIPELERIYPQFPVQELSIVPVFRDELAGILPPQKPKKGEEHNG